MIYEFDENLSNSFNFLENESDETNKYYFFETSNSKYRAVFSKSGKKKSWLLNVGSLTPKGSLKVFKILPADSLIFVKTLINIIRDFMENTPNSLAIVIKLPKKIPEKNLKITSRLIKRAKFVKYDELSVDNKNDDTDFNYIFLKNKSFPIDDVMQSLNVKSFKGVLSSETLDNVKPKKVIKRKLEISNLVVNTSLNVDLGDIDKRIGGGVFQQYTYEDLMNDIEHEPEVEKTEISKSSENPENLKYSDKLVLPVMTTTDKVKLISELLFDVPKIDDKIEVLNIWKRKKGGYQELKSFLLATQIFDEFFIYAESNFKGFKKIIDEGELQMVRETIGHLLFQIIVDIPVGYYEFFLYYSKVFSTTTYKKLTTSSLPYSCAVAMLIGEKTIPEKIEIFQMFSNRYVVGIHPNSDGEIKFKDKTIYVFPGLCDRSGVFKLMDYYIDGGESTRHYIVTEHTPFQSLITKNELDKINGMKQDNFDNNSKILEKAKVGYEIPIPLNNPYNSDSQFEFELNKKQNTFINGYSIGTIKQYTGSSYEIMNSYMRTGKPASSRKQMKDFMDEYEKTAITLEEDIVVVRRSNYPKIKTGKIYVDYAPMSTSISGSVWGGSTHMEIIIPKGTKFMAILENSNHPSEREVILAPGTMIQFVEKKLAFGKKIDVGVVIGSVFNDIKEGIENNLDERIVNMFEMKSKKTKKQLKDDKERYLNGDSELLNSTDILDKIKNGEFVPKKSNLKQK